jgi:beta-glucosidase
VKNGKVDEKLIDDAAKRILRVKFQLGLFKNPYLYCDETREKNTIGKQEFQEVVLDMAKKSIVLLKNDNNILPLKKSGQKIGVIGPLAADKTSPLGSWRIAADDETAISVLEGLNTYTENQYRYEKGTLLTTGRTEFMWETPINTTDKSDFSKAISLAKNSDVVIMVLGEHGLQSGEGRSRADLGLPGVQQELLEKVYEVNKNIVLVLQNGRPLAIEWAAKHIPAIVEAWHLGTQSGHAIAQILYGDYNPSGKLPMTFPRSVGQVPIYYNHKNTGRPQANEPESVFWSHYTDEKNTPLYPFGHGLSYTSFVYKDLKLNTDKLTDNNQIKVSVTIKNSGKYEGKEVVQLYLQDVVASITRPVKELKDFGIVSLKPNEEKTINFTIDINTIKFYTANKKWEAEKGLFKVMVGGSSDTILESSFTYE